MSSLVDRWEYEDDIFDFDDIVEFDAPWGAGDRLRGRIVRVYNARIHYHVLVDGGRYSIDVGSDNVKLIRRAK